MNEPEILEQAIRELKNHKKLYRKIIHRLSEDGVELLNRRYIETCRILDEYKVIENENCVV